MISIFSTGIIKSRLSRAWQSIRAGGGAGGINPPARICDGRIRWVGTSTVPEVPGKLPRPDDRQIYRRAVIVGSYGKMWAG